MRSQSKLTIGTTNNRETFGLEFKSGIKNFEETVESY